MSDRVEVSSAAFIAFVNSYPRPLARSVCAICEPPVIEYNDFTLGDWPESVVAWCFCDNPETFYISEGAAGVYELKGDDNMKVIREGKKPLKIIGKRLTCSECKCEFVYVRDDICVSYISSVGQEYCGVKCPSCGHEIAVFPWPEGQFEFERRGDAIMRETRCNL